MKALSVLAMLALWGIPVSARAYNETPSSRTAVTYFPLEYEFHHPGAQVETTLGH